MSELYSDRHFKPLPEEGEDMNTVDFEPAPGSTADLDYIQWQEYLSSCKKDGTSPSTSDYVVWLEEQV